MASPTIEHVGGGTYNGGGASPNSGVFGQFTTGGTNRLIVVIACTAREDTVTNINQVASVSASGLTFTRIFHDVTFTYSDSASDPSFPVGTHSVDIFTAPAAAQQTAVNWTSTMSGDGFVNDGAGVQFAVAGLDDITAPFDPNMLTLLTGINISGSSSTPNVAGITTTNPDDTLLAMFVNHRSGGGTVTPTADSGWTILGPIDATGGSGGATAFKFMAEYKSVSAPQSSLTINAGFSDQYWFGVAMAFTANPPVPPEVWASVENTDTTFIRGFVGAFGTVGDLNLLEAPDTFAATGFQPVSTFSFAVREATDTFSAFISVPIAVTMNVTETPDRFAAIGVGVGVNGRLITVEGADIFSAFGTTPISGTFVTTEAADRFLAIGAGVTQVRRRRQVFVT